MSYGVPVSPGQAYEPSARQTNQVQRLLQQQGGITGGGPINEPRPFNWIYARNDTGETLGQFAPVCLDGILFLPDDDAQPGSVNYFRTQPVMKARKPDWRFGQLWGLTLEPIGRMNDAGLCGRVLLQGIVPVRLTGNHLLPVAGPEINNVATLKTGRGDALVMWQESTDDERWGLVSLGGGQGLILEGEIVTGSDAPSDGKTNPTSGTFHAWRYVDAQLIGADPREMEAIDEDLTYVNRDPSLDPEAGAYCLAQWINGEWRLIWVGCAFNG